MTEHRADIRSLSLRLRSVAGPLLPLCVALLLGCEPASTDVSVADRDVVELLLAAENARATGQGLEPITTALTSERAEARRLAVRALGRLERPELSDRIAELLDDVDPTVRAEAANAIAQAFWGADDAGFAEQALNARWGQEHDGAVLGALASALGRLPFTSSSTIDQVEARLAEVLARPDAEALEARVGALRGLEALTRRQSSHRFRAATVDALIATLEATPSQPRARRLATAALLSIARNWQTAASLPIKAHHWQSALEDEDVEVRRLAASAASLLSDSDARELQQKALADGVASVRLAALRSLVAPLESWQCQLLRQAWLDDSVHVRLAAIDALAECATEEDTVPLLMAAAFTRPAELATAHATLALARVDAELASEAIRRLAAHESWVLRSYAARAAQTATEHDVLLSLANDEHANVRGDALRGLAQLKHEQIERLLIEALASADNQLVMQAANLLADTATSRSAITPLLAALERFTVLERETDRDVRRALLERIGTLGGPSDADSVRPYLTDFDSLVAADAAAILERWTGAQHRAQPQPLPSRPFPSIDELEQLADTRAVIEMQRGGRIVLELLPYEAPTNTERFVRLAREGLLRRTDLPPSRAQLRHPGAVALGPMSMSATAPTLATSSAPARTCAARSAFPPGAATPATARSSSTWSTT